MALSRKDYLQKIIGLHERLILASEDYESISEEFISKKELDIPAMKDQWRGKVDEFKQILADMNALEVPNAFERDGNELKEAYAIFVHCVEEKTEKFSVEAMESGELDVLQSKELHAAEDMEELIESMFDK